VLGIQCESGVQNRAIIWKIRRWLAHGLGLTKLGTQSMNVKRNVYERRCVYGIRIVSHQSCVLCGRATSPTDMFLDRQPAYV